MSVSNRHSSAALRALSLALALACAAPLHAQVTHTSTPAHHKASLSTTIKSLLADPKVSAAHWGISVTALDGTPIYALNDAQRFQPYSNTKLFTTATALASIPTTRTWQTTLSAIGSMSSASTLRGVVTIASDGDAFLSTRPMPYNAEQEPQTPSLAPLDALAFALASKLRAAGISTVDGDVVAHDLLPTDPYALGTLASDMPWGYATPVSGLIYNDNAIGLAVTPGASVGAPALLALSPDFAFYTLQNDVATVIGSRADIDLQSDSGPRITMSVINFNDPVNLHASDRALTVSGSIGVHAKPDTEAVALREPSAYIAAALKSLLAADGINVNGYATTAQDTPASASTANAVNLSVSHSSVPLLEDIVVTNKLSLNLHADLLLKHLAQTLGESATFAQGARVVRQFAINAGIRPDDFYFVDGSGLSTYDLAAPRAFTALLRYAATQPWGSDFKSSLPIGGVDGTLKERFTAAPLRGNVIAKTGTHSEGRALSGYLTCASGRTVVFSILDDHHLPGTTADRDVMDKIVAAIYSAN